MESESFWREFRGICEDREHGASELARRSLAILAASARTLVATDGMALRAQLTEQARCLQGARPSMAPLRNLLNRWCQALMAMPVEDLQGARDFAADAAKALQTASLRAVTAIAENASYLIAPGSTLMTHSMSSTLVACCRVLKSRGLRMMLI